MDTSEPQFILFVRTGCPFSARVMNVMRRMGLSWDERNISDPNAVTELIDRGGRKQTPYLVDTEADREMYESEKIIGYLAREYGTRRRTRVRV